MSWLLPSLGSQHGVIEDSRLSYLNHPSTTTSVGIDCKGGARDIVVRRSFFHSAGKVAMELGQDTGIQYFRSPPGTILSDGTIMDYEGKDIEVAYNWFVGAAGTGSPIYWMKSQNGQVHHNTIVLPYYNVMAITGSENDGLKRARNGSIHYNLIVYNYGDLMTWYEPFAIGAHPDHNNPAVLTFAFDNNAWFQLDAPGLGRHLPAGDGDWRDGSWQRDSLPTVDVHAVYQVDPELPAFESNPPEFDPATLCIGSADPRLKGIGAGTCSDIYWRVQ